MDDNVGWSEEAQMQLEEVRGLLDKIKMRVRAKQVNGLEMPLELLLLMSYLSQQEAKIWWGVRMLHGVDNVMGNLHQEDISKKVKDFKESYTRAMNLLTGINQYLS